MKHVRVLIIVEGQTEERFISQIVAPELALKGVYTSARIIGKPGHKGGNIKWQRLREDMKLLLKQDHDRYVTTFFDYFRMGTDFPGKPHITVGSTSKKYQMVCDSIMNGMTTSVVESDLQRLIPYVQMHEFEGLLFSDPAILCDGIGRSEIMPLLSDARKKFLTPEDINEGPETAPSKRLCHAWPGYQKTVHGILAAKKMTLTKIRNECSLFNSWITKLERLPRN